MAFPAPVFQPDFSGVQPSEVLALYPVMNTALQSGFAAYKPVSDAFTKVIPMDATNKLILGAVDRPYLMRLWTGEREEQPIVGRSMDVVPLPWESTIAADQFQWEDAGPQVGNYLEGIFTNVGMQISAFQDYLVGQALSAANSTVGYDGAYICSTSHPVDPENINTGTWSNDLASTPLTTENLAYAISVFKQVPGKDGLPWSNRRSGVKLVVPPALEFRAVQSVRSSMIAVAISEPGLGVSGVAPESNSFLKMSVDDVIVLQTLTDQTTWYLVDADSAALPTVVIGMRTPFNITPMVAPTSPNVFNKHLFLWGVQGRVNYGYTLPQNILRASSGAA
jgi:phage major head subunit gpT-like protein